MARIFRRQQQFGGPLIAFTNDEARTVGKGTIGWYIVRISDANRATAIASAIDWQFTNSSAETKTGTEKAFVQGFAKQTGDIGAIVAIVLTNFRAASAPWSGGRAGHHHDFVRIAVTNVPYR